MHTITSSPPHAGRVSATLIVILLMAVLRPMHVASESNYNSKGIPRYDPIGPEWNYRDFKNWPPLCHKGKRQSPISFKDLDNRSVRLDSTLEDIVLHNCDFSAFETNIRITNDVTALIVNIKPAAGDADECIANDPMGGESYRFQQLHFHANSEHLFPRAHPDSELHIVFSRMTRNAEEFLVLAVLLTATDESQITLQNVTASLVSIDTVLTSGRLPPPKSFATSTTVQETDLSALLPRRRSYLTYLGSFTTPPCTEAVRFVVFSVPQLMSQRSLTKLREALDESMPKDFLRYGNSRPPQPLYGRIVHRYVDTGDLHTDSEMEKKLMRDYIRGNWKDSLGLNSETKNNTMSNKTSVKGSEAREVAAVEQDVDAWDNTTPVAVANNKTNKPGHSGTKTTKSPEWITRGKDKIENEIEGITSGRSAGKYALFAAIAIILVGGLVYWRWHREPSFYVGIDDEELELSDNHQFNRNAYGSIRT